jgi:hypothetical protein
VCRWVSQEFVATHGKSYQRDIAKKLWGGYGFVLTTFVHEV